MLFRSYLPKHFHVIEMDWWQEIPFHDELKIAYTPAQHASGRGVRDQNRALWGGFSLLAKTGHCFFAGDTGYHQPLFQKIGEEYGPFDYGLVPIGGYGPEEKLFGVHATPEQAIKIGEDIGAYKLIGMHWGALNITTEPLSEPPKRFYAASTASQNYRPEDVVTLRIGQAIRLYGDPLQ